MDARTLQRLLRNCSRNVNKKLKAAQTGLQIPQMLVPSSICGICRNQDPWRPHCRSDLALNHQHIDTGLLGVFCVVQHQEAGPLTPVSCEVGYCHWGAKQHTHKYQDSNFASRILKNMALQTNKQLGYTCNSRSVSISPFGSYSASPTHQVTPGAFDYNTCATPSPVIQPLVSICICVSNKQTSPLKSPGSSYA